MNTPQEIRELKAQVAEVEQARQRACKDAEVLANQVAQKDKEIEENKRLWMGLGKDKELLKVKVIELKMEMGNLKTQYKTEETLSHERYCEVIELRKKMGGLKKENERLKDATFPMSG